MGGTQEHVEPAHVEILDRARHAADEKLMIAHDAVDFLQTADAHSALFQWSKQAAPRNGGEDAGITPHGRHLREDMLGASVGREPIRNECEFHGGASYIIVPVPLRPSTRLPRRFRRTVSSQIRAFAGQRHRRARARRTERWRRVTRKAFHGVLHWRKSFQWWLLGTVTAFALMLAGLAIFSPIFTVREIRIQRSDVRVDTERIQLALSPLFRRHLLFLTTQEVEELVAQTVPDLDQVTISKQFPSLLLIRIRLKPLVARLQIGVETSASMPERSDGDLAAASGALLSEYLTANGVYIQHPSPELGETLPLLRVVDWGTRPAPGDRLIPPEFLQRMRAAEEALLAEFGQGTDERTVYLRSREFHLRTGKITLWFDFASSLQQQLDRYRIFLKSVGLQEAKEYIDLRLAGKVAYR